MPTDHCPLCNKPLADHPDGLACCPFCGGRMMHVPQREASTCAQCTMCYARGPLGVISLTAKTLWNRRAPHAETLRLRAALDKMRSELTRIADDYVPDNDGQAPLALSEMREAIHDLLAELKEPAHD